VSLRVHGQEFIGPQTFNFYPDSMAVYLTQNPDEVQREINLVVQSAYGDIHFKTLIKDTVIMVPYYTLYDNERMLVVRMDAGWGRKNYNRIVDSEFMRLMTIKKTDSLESAIYRVMEKASEKNLLALARGFEQMECFGNALYVYYKLYRLGYRKYWIDFIKRNPKRRSATKAVHR
jgi:hypothetical protein